MLAAGIVAAAYAIILLRYGRHCFNSGFFAFAGIATFHAWAIQSLVEDMQNGGRTTWFRIPLFEYGELTFLGWALLIFSGALQLGWLGMTFKSAMEADYKSITPAGDAHRIGTSGGADWLVRQVYGLLHKFLGEPSHLEMDREIARAFGTFEQEVSRQHSRGEPADSMAVKMAADIWRRRIDKLSPGDKRRLARGFEALETTRLDDLPPIAESIAIGIRHASEMAESGQISNDLADYLSGEIIWCIQGLNPEQRQARLEERTAERAKEFGRDVAASLVQAVDDFFADVDERLKPLYLETLAKRLEMQELSPALIADERLQFAREMDNLQADTREQLERKIGEWLKIASEMGIRDRIERYVSDGYASAKAAFIEAAEPIFRRYENSN